MNKALGAQAFAHGNDIFYGAGKSPGKNELTAHELTHTIQQGGGVQAKLETPDEALSEAASTKTDSSGNGQTQTAVTPVDSQTKTEPSKVEAPDTEHSSQELGAQAEAQQNGQGDKEKLAQSGQPKLSVSVETASSQGNAPQGVDTGSEAKAQGGTNPATQAVQSVNPQQQVKLPSEVQAQAEGKPTQGGEQAKGKDGTGKAGQGEGKALEQVPQAQALKEATAQNQAASPKPEGRGEAANLPAEADNQQSKAVAEQGKAQLEATNAQAQQLASAGVNFAPPEEEQAGQLEEGSVIAMKAETPGGDSAALKERSAKASSIASSFVATASGKVQTITGLGAGIPVRIHATAENAKARVRAAVEQQKAAVTAQITQQRAKAQSKAQATIAQIQAQYQAAVGAIPGETAKAREKVSAEYATSVKSVDAREKSQVTQIEGIYARAGSEFRNAGARVGDEAVRIANQKASEYKSRDSGAAQVASFLGLGAVSDVAFGTETLKNKARAQAAESVGQEYKKALIAKGEECAKQAEQGKQKDIDTVRQTAAKSRETLQTQQKAALDSLNAAEQQAKQQAQQAQTQLNQTANQSLEATLTSLDQQQATQLQMLTAQGQQQIAAIEGSAQKAIASLQNAINQSASGLRGTLQSFQAQAKSAQAPDPDALSAAVAQAQGRIDGEIGKIRAQVEQGIAASVQSITQSGQQSVEGLSSIGQGAIESATTLSQGLTTTMTGLKQSATDTFKQIQQAHTKTTTETAKTAVDGFKQVTEGIEKTFQETSKGLEDQFQQHVKEVEKALQGALNDLPGVINEEAEKAAAQVDPKKELLKLVVIVAVVVVAALVVGPFAAGLLAPLGAMGTILAGAAVGALSGAVIQMASNAIDGKNLLDGVGQAALFGAIGGALGAGIGMALGGALKGVAGNVAGKLGERAGGGLRSAGNFALDVAQETIADIATNIATGQFSWDSIGESLLFSVFGAGLSRSAAGQRISDGAQNRGTQIRSNVSDRVTNAFGGSTGDRTPIDVTTPEKPPVLDETTPTDKTPSSQSGDRPPTDISTPRKPPVVNETTPADTTPSNQSGDRTPTDISKPTKPPVSEETAPTKPPVSEETTFNGRSTHFDKPEVEPGVVAKDQTANGREIKVTKEGEVLRCMGCEVDNNPRLEEKSDPQEKIEEAKKLDEESAAPDTKRKAEDTEESGESSTKKAKTEKEAVNDREVGSSGKRWDDPSMTEAEFIADYKERFPNTSLSDDTLKQRFQEGMRLNPETGRLATPVRPIEPTGTRQNLPTEGEKYEAWQAYVNGDKSKPPCFPTGTLVKTPEGDKAIENLAPGEFVFAYDFDANCVVERPITAVHKNWTQFIVVIETEQGKLSSTRSHPYWVESESKWLRAVDIQKGMMLRLINSDLLTVHSVETYAAEEDTYNFEVEQLHNYFVNLSGVLVHNGGGDGNTSGFEKTETFATDIYEVRDFRTGEVIYVGKTIQGTDPRFDHHLSDPKSAVYDYINNPNSKGYIPLDDPLRKAPNFPKNLIDNVLQSTSVRDSRKSGGWTRYETAVWEQYYIDQHGGVGGSKLINRINAITPEKFVLYSQGHNPCM
jgi:hypothetical protein